MRILILTKRQYTNKDLLDDRFGRIREIPLALSRHGHDVRGLCLSYITKESELRYDESVLWESMNAGIFKLVGLGNYIKKAYELAKQSDVIIAFSDSFYGIIAYYLSKRIGIPFVFDLMDNFEYFFVARLPLLKQLFHRAVLKAHAVTCVSHGLKQLISNYKRHEAVFVVENAVCTDIFKPLNRSVCRHMFGLPDKVTLVGTAGALHSNRGIESLFSAWQILRRVHPKLHLVLAGPKTPDVKIPKDERVHYYGVIPYQKIPFFLNALDVAIVCNSLNAFGRFCFPQKAREIMACNLPIVAAAVPALRGLLSDHPEWLYAPDDPRSLASVLENRLTDRRTNYGRVLTWEDVGREMENILQNIA